ncbi:ribosome biogenesis GTP-binding protein YihA/YsxC [Candidatus Erwinia haradaeae]|uniref:Probable GTP-binding protein EngB n=1 Tax=Candidatus Erwinia haradaeae TaxID=1922217 RepID=A0A451D9C2_9GAMM|nr:ribosome biogenesis GTP-binding protein YihA/YsxC [Candidatus Erwinia haradaeae]VFP82845.1 Probable GTP-binding protein EngB [Candidatus Erwinia haradaeae]
MFVWNYNLTHFITSAPNIHYLPEDTGVEIAFIGRSNSGKSSALNALTNQKNLARTSKTPGSTKFINLFQISVGYRLADLPGYGYSATTHSIKIQCKDLLVSYLKYRLSLRGLLILMDIRHPLQALDRQIILLALKNKIEIFILLTKADKLSHSSNLIQLNTVRKATNLFADKIKIELFSAKKKLGVDTLQQQLNTWYHNSSL